MERRRSRTGADDIARGGIGSLRAPVRTCPAVCYYVRPNVALLSCAPSHASRMFTGAKTERHFEFSGRIMPLA
eukprot:6893545-Prymnesium_polylepis.1